MGSTCPRSAWAPGAWAKIGGEPARVAALRLALEIGYRVIDTAEMPAKARRRGSGRRRSPRRCVPARCGATRCSWSAGLPAQRQPHRRAHGLRAQPPAPRAGSHRPLPAALARLASAGRNAGRLRGAARAGAHRAGASATSTSTTWTNWPTCAAVRPARPTGSTTRSASAAPAMRCCPGCSATACPDGLLPDRPGRAGRDARLAELAARRARRGQLALAWAMQPGRRDGDSKAVREAHLRENFAAAAITLTPEDLAALDAIFPPPRQDGAGDGVKRPAANRRSHSRVTPGSQPINWPSRHSAPSGAPASAVELQARVAAVARAARREAACRGAPAQALALRNTWRRACAGRGWRPRRLRDGAPAGGFGAHGRLQGAARAAAS